MPGLTRREKDRQQESWHIYYGDVQVGWIGEHAGVPKDADQWGWSCETFDEARAAFDSAWLQYRANCREADFEAWRPTARLHGMEIRDAGDRLQVANTN